MGYYCTNCKDRINPMWRITLCASCRRIGRQGIFAGGVLVGVAFGILKWAGWL